MLRRALAVLLATALALGWTSAAMAAGCATAAGAAIPTLSVVKGACGSCEDGGGGQPQQGCTALACASGCVSGPATTPGVAWHAVNVDADQHAQSAPHAALRVRAIPPDQPPPR